MKKLISLSLALVLALSLAACGSSTPASPNTEAPEAATPEAAAPEAAAPANDSGELTIVMVAKHEGISWFDDMRVGVDQFGEDFDGVNSYQIAPEGGDPAKQVQMVEDLIAQGVDAILVVPNDAQAMAPVLKKAKEAGIVVISHEATDLADIVDYDMEAFRNEDHGVRFAEELAKQMGGEGKFASMVGALTMTTHMQWYNSMQDHLKANYPDMEMVAAEPYEDKNDNKLAYDKALEILKAHPDLKGFTDCAASGAGIAQALSDKNRNDIALVSTAVPSQAGAYIQDGFMDMGLCWRPADAGYVTCLIAYKMLKGEEITDGMSLEKPGYEKISLEGNIIYADAPLVIVADNVKDYNF